MPDPIQPTVWQDYLFDLQGFLVLPGCASPAQLADMNARVDSWIADDREWIGGVHRHVPDGVYSAGDGKKLLFNNCIEGGGVFEEMIDNPAWLGFVRRYLDPDGLHLYGNQVALGPPGAYTSMHAGGYLRTCRSSYGYHDGAWHCGKIMVIMALTDIGPGDGATVVIPGSHLTNLPNPSTAACRGQRPPLETEGGDLIREIRLRAGEALVFTDAIEHGAAVRTNPGTRRILLHRYSCVFGRDHAYEPSDELVARLTPERRKIVRPIAPVRRPQPASSHFASSR